MCVCVCTFLSVCPRCVSVALCVRIIIWTCVCVCVWHCAFASQQHAFAFPEARWGGAVSLSAADNNVTSH